MQQSLSPITINKNCVSCSGNALYARKAFKIACLAYYDSKVMYEGQLYDRTELITMRKQILELVDTKLQPVRVSTIIPTAKDSDADLTADKEVINVMQEYQKS